MCDGQSAPFADAGVMLLNSSYIRFVNCTIRHVGGYGLHIGSFSAYNQFINGTITDTGAGGVMIGNIGSSLPYLGPASEPHNNVVVNSYLTLGGRTTPAGCGVLIQRSSYNRIANNFIHDYYYTGVSVGWDWQYEDGVQSVGNIVLQNRIDKIGDPLQLSDLGGIYTLGNTTVAGARSLIERNWISNVSSYNYGAWGIYLDQASGGYTVSANLVHDTKSAMFHQHWGWANLVQNNIFAFGGEGQPDGGLRTDPGAQVNTFVFDTNIVLHSQGTLFYGQWNFSLCPFQCYKFGTNLWWGAPLEFPSGFNNNSGTTHQILQDPLFINANARNFNLSPKSPAFAMGFKPINLHQIGPQ